MTVLAKILAWSNSLPLWERDALRRLFVRRELTDKDYQELVLLVKQENGIPIKKPIKASPLTQEQIAQPAAGDSPVILRSISKLTNVNALSDKETLPFGERGVTVIYGDNGAGKSGYSRVLKRACRARDVEETVLPNVTIPRARQGQPTALLTISVDGEEITEQWSEGEDSPENLSALSVFDGHCARVYLDDENDVAFKPYGLEIVEELAQVCASVKEALQEECDAMDIDLDAFEDLKGPTRVGTLISELSEKTELTEITELAALTVAEQQKAVELTAALKQGNALEKAKVLRATSSRVLRLAAACDTAAQAVSDSEVTRYKSIADARVVAQRQSDAVAKKLKSDTAFLRGTGGKLWKALLDAAERYSQEAYPGHAFPHTEAGARCVLCQQELKDGKDRLLRFNEIIKDTTESTLRAANSQFSTAGLQIERLSLGLPMDEELLGDIRSIDAKVATACTTFQKSLNARKTSFANAMAKQAWAGVTKLSATPGPALRAMSEGMLGRAKTFEQSADTGKRKLLEKELQELTARKALGTRKAAVIKAVQQMRLHALLSKCARSIDTTGISRKATALTNETVSEALGNALNAEFKTLGIQHLQVSLKHRTEVGTTFHKLQLNVPSTEDISSILSEGEQRALAIASFLAEISLSGNTSGVIFDDPVSSLDHRHREHVAERLVREGKARQVIVFTHDLYFLHLLLEIARGMDVPILPQSIQRKSTGTIGIVSSDLPFEGQNTKQRVGYLKQVQQKAAAAQRAGDQQVVDALVKDGYEKLREAWERAVEEVLLRGVIQRFSREIQTQRLAGLAIEDQDFAEIKAGMTRCSMFTHDKPRAAGTTAFDPVQFEKDIGELESFRTRVEKRADEIAKTRKQ